VTNASFVSHKNQKKSIHNIACKMFSLILDSEQSDEYIDFTTMCGLFFCVSSPFGAIKVLRFSTSG